MKLCSNRSFIKRNGSRQVSLPTFKIQLNHLGILQGWHNSGPEGLGLSVSSGKASLLEMDFQTSAPQSSYLLQSSALDQIAQYALEVIADGGLGIDTHHSFSHYTLHGTLVGLRQEEVCDGPQSPEQVHVVPQISHGNHTLGTMSSKTGCLAGLSQPS